MNLIWYKCTQHIAIWEHCGSILIKIMTSLVRTSWVWTKLTDYVVSIIRSSMLNGSFTYTISWLEDYFTVTGFIIKPRGCVFDNMLTLKSLLCTMHQASSCKKAGVVWLSSNINSAILTTFQWLHFEEIFQWGTREYLAKSWFEDDLTIKPSTIE